MSVRFRFEVSYARSAIVSERDQCLLGFLVLSGYFRDTAHPTWNSSANASIFHFPLVYGSANTGEKKVNIFADSSSCWALSYSTWDRKIDSFESYS